MILAFTAFTVMSAVIDQSKIEHGKTINHKTNFIIRVCVALILAFIFHYPNYLKMIAGMLLMGAIFWLVFDLLLNLLRGKHLFYVGETAYIDRLFTNRPVLMHSIKISLVVIFSIIYLAV